MTRAAHRIVVAPVCISGERGQHYRVFHAGSVLIERTWNPEYESARALLAKGICGRFEMWRPGKAHPDAIVDIERAAGGTIVENAGDGPRTARWVPFDDARAAVAVGRQPPVGSGGYQGSRGGMSAV